jgi:hypothetical protein
MRRSWSWLVLLLGVVAAACTPSASSSVALVDESPASSAASATTATSAASTSTVTSAASTATVTSAGSTSIVTSAASTSASVVRRTTTPATSTTTTVLARAIGGATLQDQTVGYTKRTLPGASTAMPTQGLPGGPIDLPMPGAGPPPAPPTHLGHAPCQLALLADSVGHDLLLNGLASQLAGVGCPIAWSRVQRGSPLGDGVRALTAVNGSGADAIFVLQGYSKASSHRGEFPGLVDQVMRMANGRPVVWTLYGRTSDCSAGYTRTLDGFNMKLLATAQQAANLRLIDYPAVIRAHPEYSQHRCPHLLAGGSRAVSAFMAGEVRRLVNFRQ